VLFMAFVSSDQELRLSILSADGIKQI
jgi:hypothetical protein